MPAIAKNHLTVDETALVRSLVVEVGLPEAARRLGICVPTLTRLLAGLPSLAITVTHVRVQLFAATISPPKAA